MVSEEMLTFSEGLDIISLVVVDADFVASSTIFIGSISYKIFSPFVVFAILSVASQTVLFFS